MYNLSVITWLIFSCMVFIVFLFAKYYVLKKNTSKTRDLFLSFYGIFILGFLFHFVFRFIFHVWDPIVFQASATPLWTIPDPVFSYTFLLLILFFISASFGYKFIMKIKIIPFYNIAKIIYLDPTSKAVTSLDMLTFMSFFATFLGTNQLFTIPRVLVTPIGYMSSLFIIPATFAWYWHFSGEKIGGRRFIYLIPGILAYSFQPFREQILTIASCVIIPMMIIRPNFKLKKLVVGGIFMFIIITLFNYAYRDIVWKDQSTKNRFDIGLWVIEPQTSPWIQAVSRFHGLDSFVLTVYSIPTFFPYTNRNIPAELIANAFIPRLLYQDKSDQASNRGIGFSETVWSLGMINEIVSARIAPSMPGDLFSANGILMVIIGGLIWGFFIGMFDKWQTHSPDLVKAILLTFIGTKVFASVERDFIIVVSYLIQILIVIYFLFSFLKAKEN